MNTWQPSDEYRTEPHSSKGNRASRSLECAQVAMQIIAYLQEHAEFPIEAIVFAVAVEGDPQFITAGAGNQEIIMRLLNRQVENLNDALDNNKAPA